MLSLKTHLAQSHVGPARYLGAVLLMLKQVPSAYGKWLLSKHLHLAFINGVGAGWFTHSSKDLLFNHPLTTSVRYFYVEVFVMACRVGRENDRLGSWGGCLDFGCEMLVLLTSGANLFLHKCIICVLTDIGSGSSAESSPAAENLTKHELLMDIDARFESPLLVCAPALSIRCQ